MRRTTKVLAIAAAVAGFTGLTIPAAFAGTGPSSSANVPVSAEVGTTLGFGVAPTSVQFGQVNPGAVSFASQSFTVVGNDSYGLTLEDSDNAGYTSSPQTVMTGATSGGLPVGSLWFAPTTAPASIVNDYWVDMQGNKDANEDSAYSDPNPSASVLTDSGQGEANTITQSNNYPLLPVDGEADSGTSEAPPSGGSNSYVLSFALNLPMSTVPQEYSTTLVYSLTGA